MSVILLQPAAISTERSTDRPCALDMCNTTRSFTHESNTCVIRRLAFLHLGSIDLPSCTAPYHPPQPRIAEFWFVYEPRNFEITLREVGGVVYFPPKVGGEGQVKYGYSGFITTNKQTKKQRGFPRNCVGVRHWVILVAPRRVRKIN